MRSWIPWSLLVVLTAFASASAVVGATTEHRAHPTQRDLLSPVYAPAGILKTIQTSAPTTFPPQAGYRGIEDFCAVAPLTGTIHYDGTSGGLIGVLAASVGDLPPNDEIFVNWSDSDVRAPVVGSFETDSKGAAIPSSVEVVRLGEVRGVGVVLSAASVPNPVLGHLEPC